MKVVINRSYAGFSLSDKAGKYLNWKYNIKIRPCTKDKCYIVDDLARNDPRLIDCVETLGEAANGFLADLKVVEIPDNVDWIISDDYGKEIIEEVHRSWC